jgi:predicted ABC-type sugar transport system permease subunit
MFKFLKCFLICFMMISFVSCSEQQKIDFKTSTATLLANGMSHVIIAGGDCQEVALVQADTQAMVNKWFGLKKLDEKGLVGMICSLAVKEITPFIFSTLSLQVKPEWKCKYTTVQQTIDTFATMACAAIPI